MPTRSIGAEVTGREKTIYSIYKKMRDKQLSFSQVLDVYGFRVVVESALECYTRIGALHALYKPVPGKFKDYIAIPKVNGYQSLHTTLVGPFGAPIEFQIRTRKMHEIAEAGVAAHWLYKNGGADLERRAEARAPVAASRCSTSRAKRAIRANSSNTSRSTCSRMRSTCSRRSRRSWRCRAAPPRSTSRIRSTPTSATSASR